MHQTTVDCYDNPGYMYNTRLSREGRPHIKTRLLTQNECNLFGRGQPDGVGLEVVDGVVASEERIA